MQVNGATPFKIEPAGGIRKPNGVQDARRTRPSDSTRQPNKTAKDVNRSTFGDISNFLDSEKILSSDEKKLFELLFPVDTKPAVNKFLKLYEEQNKPLTNDIRQNKKILGNRLDIQV